MSPASSCSESLEGSICFGASGTGEAALPLVPFTSCGLATSPGTNRDERFTCRIQETRFKNVSVAFR